MKMERRSPRAVCLFRRTERKKERANRFKRVQKNHNDQGSQKKSQTSSIEGWGGSLLTGGAG